MAQRGRIAFYTCLLSGLLVAGYGFLGYMILPASNTQQWGPFSIRDGSGNPVGNLWLRFTTTNPLFAVGSNVKVQARFNPWAPPGYPYSYVLFFPNSTSPSPTAFSLTSPLPPPQFGEVLLHLDTSNQMYDGNSSFMWSTPGIHGVEVRLLDIRTNTTGSTVASADNVMVVASEEALQSATTNNIVIGLTFVVIGIAVIQLYSVYSDFSRKSTS